VSGRCHHSGRSDKNVLPLFAAQSAYAEEARSLARRIFCRRVELLLHATMYQLDLAVILSVAPAIELRAPVVAYRDNERRAMNLGPQRAEFWLIKFVIANAGTLRSAHLWRPVRGLLLARLRRYQLHERAENYRNH
jgi:hypothetical protein